MARRDVRQLDEDDVRVRPQRQGSRPRSKQRPTHETAAEGMVITVDRGRYTVLVGGDPSHSHGGPLVVAMRARELRRTGIVVGDQVSMVGDLSGEPDSLARIVRIGERMTVLRRTADDTDPVERVIVANADQLVIMASLAEPPPSFGLIDRGLVAALTAGLEPIVFFTKSDLVNDAEIADARARYEELDVQALVTQKGASLDPVREVLVDEMSVFVGHSGVGKSTLINALVPDANRATGTVTAIGKGRHTSTSAIALQLPDIEGWVIDTPGVRSFGLAHVSADDLLWAFPDLEDGAVRCPPGCEHLSADAGCTLDAWVASGHSTPTRLAAFRRLLTSRIATD